MTILSSENHVTKIAVVSERSRPHRLKTEAWALSQALQRGLNVPGVLDHDINGSGQETLILERINGTRVSLLCGLKRSRCLISAGEQLSKLGDLSISFGWINSRGSDGDFGSTTDWSKFLQEYVQKYGLLLESSGILGKHITNSLLAILRETTFCVSPFLINRDIKTSNLLLSADGRVWILDWEDAIFGDPLYDIAMFGVKYGRGIQWKNFVHGYGMNVHVPHYQLYESIALMGMIHFYAKHGVVFNFRTRQLENIVQKLFITRSQDFVF